LPQNDLNVSIPGKAGGFKIGGPSKGPRFPTFDDVPEYTLVARHFITLSALLHRSEGTGPYAQSMGAPPRVDFLRDRDPRARIPPEMSNFYCRPGKAGGSPMILEVLATGTQKLADCVSVERPRPSPFMISMIFSTSFLSARCMLSRNSSI